MSVTEPQHCTGCDTYDCPGFTTPRAKPEPVPDPPLRVATDEARRRYITDALARVEQIRRELRGSK